MIIISQDKETIINFESITRISIIPPVEQEYKYSIANTKTVIQKPKEYFKKCILSAIGQTELSTQYDAYTIEMGAV